MMRQSWSRRLMGCVVASLVCVGGAFAQSAGMDRNPKQLGDFQKGQSAINASQDVKFEQKLNVKLSLDTPFRDENDNVVPLKTYFGKRPVVLVMPFYKCAGVCTQELNGLVDVFKNPQLKYKVGRDFDAVVISINPTEKGDLATMKKRQYLDMLAMPGADDGWHFLTGDEANIRKIADEIGFKYKYDTKTDQYAHAAGIVVLTPEGKTSRYFYGVVYPSKDLRLSLTEAGKGKMGGSVEQIILYCYHYDPDKGKYGLAVFRLLQVAGLTTLVVLGSFIFLSLRQERRDALAHKSSAESVEKEAEHKG